MRGVPLMFPIRFRLRSLMIFVIPAVGIGAWTYRVLPKCPVHGTVMWRGSVPINYGIFSFAPATHKYMKVRDSLFPNCDDAVLGGSAVGPDETLSKNICRTCNATRVAWRLSQIKATRTISAISAGSNPRRSATSDSK
jgi:hypothetical protein